MPQRDYEAESRLKEALCNISFSRFRTLNPVYLKTVDSTQEYLSKVLKSEREGDLAISEIQTAGKGREGRVWESDKGGVWMTITLKPDAPEMLGNLSLTIAKSVASTLENYGAEDCVVKPPNDIYCNQKKIGGVLVDSVITGQECLAYVGIGVNVNNDVRTNESIAKIAISLKEILGKEISLVEFIVSLLKNLDREYAAMFSASK